MKKKIFTILVGVCFINIISGQTIIKKESRLNHQLIEKLDSIHNDDQKYRAKIESVQEKYGIKSIELNDLWKIISQKDSINQIKVKTFLDKYGWLGEDIIGEKGNKTLFLVVQHGNIEFKLKYLPIMRKAAINGKVKTKDLALLEDRVLMMQGKKQIYGSQIGINPETGDYFILPIKDPDNVDKRRVEIGLKPMSEYVSIWNLNWDIEEHKKITKDSENKN